MPSLPRIGRFAFVVLSAALITPSAPAATLSFSGDFFRDDERRTFSVSAAKAANLTIRTLSYAGGVNAAGASIPPGGFDPTLSVFDSSGALIGLNRDGGCGQVAPDPVTLLCWDSVLTISVPAGTYKVVLTQSENIPFGPTISDPFAYDGGGDFTFDPMTAVSNGFWDLSLHRRTGAFAVDIAGADSVQLGVTPTSSALLDAGSGLAGQPAPNDILSFYDAGLAGGPVTVSIGGETASVLYPGLGQLNFVVPGDISTSGPVALQISRGSVLLLSTTLNGTPDNPSLFTNNGQGTDKRPY